MIRILLLAGIFLWSMQLLAQKYKPFSGRFRYEVSFVDSLRGPQPLTSYMTVFTNDTLVRVESETVQLGKQIMIRHLILKKYYLLLEIDGQKFAIQHLDESDSSKQASYQFKKRWGSKQFAGQKAKKMEVTRSSGGSTQTVYYLKKISPKYTGAISGIPGLPVSYQIQTENGLYTYKLLEWEEKAMDKDLFGIPSDYKRVSFEQFIEAVSGNQN
ncbi:MAG: hypothetical protein EP338_04590 [Bacteroidetes bacterium]|nr:MAG: hypothetical protein EP338_04590 [Bacteroidota bacterium]